MDKIFKRYLEQFKTTLRADQEGRKWSYYKSCMESKLRTECGSRLIANAIWEIGLPRLPSFATEQAGQQLWNEAIDNVLKWLYRLAYTISQHKRTAEYQTAKRKSGHTHGQSGLTATELQTRKANRKAKCNLHTAMKLARQMKNAEQT